MAAGVVPASFGIVHRRRTLAPLVVTYACLGMAPDLDFLFGLHSSYTHSVGATLVAALVSVASVRSSGLALGVSAGAAYGSHLPLDWLGPDNVAPFGIMALWPFSDGYHLAGTNWFVAVCRQYWRAACWWQLVQAVILEVVLLGPIAALGILLARRTRRYDTLS
jgi:inner membrane protein